jgi:hypothetical protein
MSMTTPEMAIDDVILSIEKIVTARLIFPRLLTLESGGYPI